MADILLKNAFVIQADGTYLTNQMIQIHNGTIEKIATDLEIPKMQYDEIIDCSSYVVTPGIPNMHVHTAMDIFRGIAEDVTTTSWFNDYIWPYESKMTSEDVYLGSVLGILEMLNNGITSICDHYFEEQQVLKAVLETGIRAEIAPTLFGSADNFNKRFDEVCTFMNDNLHVSDKVTFRMGPHALYTCPQDSLKRMVEEARKMHLGIHIHVSETKEQVEDSKKRYGKTPVQLLSEAGGFEVPCLVAHGIWIEEQDLQYLNKNTFFAFCPKAYMKSATGDGNIYRLRDKLQYSFGTDGAAGSNTLNVVEQARFYALIGKYNGNDAEQFTAKEIWRALMLGHQAMQCKSGQIRPGWNADLVLWDLNQVNTYPVYDPIAAILYSSDSSNVAYTMVDGKFLKKDGVLCQDTKEIIGRIQEAQQALLKRGKGRAIVVYGGNEKKE